MRLSKNWQFSRTCFIIFLLVVIMILSPIFELIYNDKYSPLRLTLLFYLFVLGFFMLIYFDGNFIYKGFYL